MRGDAEAGGGERAARHEPHVSEEGAGRRAAGAAEAAGAGGGGEGRRGAGDEGAPR